MPYPSDPFPASIRGRTAVLVLAALTGVFLAQSANAAAGGSDPDWTRMAINLFGGLALFLFGLEQMAAALKAVAGERLKVILARLTTNRYMGAVTGAFVTAVIQSSSVTTVLVVGFISAGLMSMSQSIGVIMGANIGTTITAQIVAFKVTKAAMVMIAVGFGMLFASKREKIQQYGTMIMGLGMIFFGMNIMSEAMQPLREFQPFLDLMTRMENPLLAILVSAGFTALVQSSSATTGIVIVMASQGFISLPTGIALAFGANIGTCVTALIASLGKPREALRAALVHVLFNVFGVLLWVGFIDELARLVTALSPTHPELQGIDRLSQEAPRQIANAHTVFNIANTLIFIWFTVVFARMVEWLVPDKPEAAGEVIRPRYLEESLLDTPSLALDRARMEIGHLGETLNRMVEGIRPAFNAGSRSRLRAIARMDDDIDILHQHIVSYLSKLGRKALSDRESHILSNLLSATNDLEALGDLVESDLVMLAMEASDRKLVMSDGTRGMLEDLHKAVAATVGTAIEAVSEDDAELATRVIERKREIHRLADNVAGQLDERLHAEAPNRLALYAMEVSVIEKLRRVYYLAKRVAKTVVEPEQQAAAE